MGLFLDGHNLGNKKPNRGKYPHRRNPPHLDRLHLRQIETTAYRHRRGRAIRTDLKTISYQVVTKEFTPKLTSGTLIAYDTG